uniref:Secreted protein n=1 Tax=Romanomermis culicivorax TaxID=13658 RepID=A0A915K050_ROMCU
MPTNFAQRHVIHITFFATFCFTSYWASNKIAVDLSVAMKPKNLSSWLNNGEFTESGTAFRHKISFNRSDRRSSGILGYLSVPLILIINSTRQSSELYLRIG